MQGANESLLEYMRDVRKQKGKMFTVSKLLVIAHNIQTILFQVRNLILSLLKVHVLLRAMVGCVKGQDTRHHTIEHTTDAKIKPKNSPPSSLKCYFVCSELDVPRARYTSDGRWRI